MVGTPSASDLTRWPGTPVSVMQSTSRRQQTAAQLAQRIGGGGDLGFSVNTPDRLAQPGIRAARGCPPPVVAKPAPASSFRVRGAGPLRRSDRAGSKGTVRPHCSPLQLRRLSVILIPVRYRRDVAPRKGPRPRCAPRCVDSAGVATQNRLQSMTTASADALGPTQRVFRDFGADATLNPTALLDHAAAAVERVLRPNTLGAEHA